jgi:hypothetical protein
MRGSYLHLFIVLIALFPCIRITKLFQKIFALRVISVRLCGLVVRVPGYRPRRIRFDSLRYQIF